MRSVLIAAVVTLTFSTWAPAQEQPPPLDELIATVTGADPVKSAAAITAIGKRRPATESAIQTLLDALADNRRAEHIPDCVPITFHVDTVGTAASDALAEIGKPAVLPICALLDDKHEKNVRILAIGSLTQMQETAEAALPTLERLLKDTEKEIRLEAAVAVVSIQKNASALSSKLGPVLFDESPDVRSVAIGALRDLGAEGSPHVASLVKLLDDKDNRWHFITPAMTVTRPIRYDSAMALAEMGSDARAALPKLRELMNRDSETLVRVAAAYAIAKLDKVPQDTVDLLIESVRDQESGFQIREMAAEALGELGPSAKAALPALVAASKHPEDPLLQMYAIGAIASIAPESAEARLLPMLRDKEALVRASAIEGLATLRTASPQLVSSLIAALNDRDSTFGENVRRAAALALGKFGKDATPALARLNRLVKEEENRWVKEAAEEAIRQIKQQEMQ